MGIEVVRSKRGSFFKKQYALVLLQDSGKFGSRQLESPSDPSDKLSEKDGLLISDVVMYQRLLGHLLYLSLQHQDIAMP